MSAAATIRKQTVFFIRDLHAREMMRLGWYRQFAGSERHQQLRERKAQHQAFLRDLLRRRGLGPIWYARLFYYTGHVFGLCTALLPEKWALKIERTLEFWIMMRYQRYFRLLRLSSGMRSMIEALQLHKLNHNEPGADVLQLLEQYVAEQEGWLAAARA